MYVVRVAELWLGSPRDVLTLSAVGDMPREHTFRGRHAADGDMDADDLDADRNANTTMYIVALALNVTLETDEVRAAKGFRLEIAACMRSFALHSLCTVYTVLVLYYAMFCSIKKLIQNVKYSTCTIIRVHYSRASPQSRPQRRTRRDVRAQARGPRISM